jgi:glycosyltransferase involved in cell wall biosynthesis
MRWRDISTSISLCVAHSDAARRLLLVNGIADEKILFSPPGFDLQDLPAADSSKISAATAGVRFGFVGRLCGHKGVQTLVESWKKANPQLPESCTLTFWGDPKFGDAESVAAIEQLAKFDPRVTLRGGFSRVQLAEVYGSMDVLIVPSEWFDNCPFVISEAFTFGIPVIGSDFGGISTMVEEGQNGWLFPMKDSSVLASIISDLARSPQKIAIAANGVNPPRPFTNHADEVLAEIAKLIV